MGSAAPGVETVRQNLTNPPAVVAGPAAFALCGLTKKGPVEDPDNGRVSSWEEFKAKFGDLDANLYLPLMVQAFFNEGGQQAIINRVVATDAVAASKTWTEGGLYATAVAPTGARGLVGVSDHSATPTRVFSITLGALEADIPYVIRYWAIGALNTVAQGTKTMAGGAETIAYTAGSDGYATGATASQKRLEPGSVKVERNAGATTYYDNGDGTFIAAGDLTSGTVNYDTGAISLVFSAGTLGHTIKLKFRRIVDRVEKTIVITGDDTFTGDYDSAGTNTINRTTGAVSFTTASATYAADGVAQANYTAASDGYNWNGASETGEAVSKVEVDGAGSFFSFTALYAGVWGNSVRLVVEGDPDYFTESTQTFTRAVVWVEEQDADGVWGIISGKFRKVSLTSTTDANYILTVLNNVTDTSRVVEAAASTPGFPTKLNGLPFADVLVVAGTGIAEVVDLTVDIGSVGPGSVNITYTDASDREHVITDDGLGNLVGSDPSAAATLDATAVSTVDYDTGRIQFTTGQLVKNSTNVLADFYSQPQTETVYVTLASGSDGSALTRAMISASALSATKQGMYALSKIKDNMLLGLPDFAGDSDVATDQIAYSDDRGNLFTLLCTPQGYTSAQAKAYRTSVLGADSASAALYYPWITVSDPLTLTPVTMPPLGHVAGIYSSVDRSRSPGKTPAGVVDGAIKWALGIERKLDLDVDVAGLNDVGVCCIMDSKPTGRSLWGARTLLRDRNAFGAYIVDTRVQNHALALAGALMWTKVFEGNSPGLWSDIQRAVTNLVKQDLFDRGALAGSAAADGFRVVCNASNNSESAVDIVCDIYLATKKPGLFFKVRASQKQASK
jgi:phage tail sheath protein FI